MKVDKKDAELLTLAINEWEQEGKITPEKSLELKESIEYKTTGNQQIAQYFFFISVSCILLSFGAIFIDDKLVEKVKQYFSLNNLFIAIAFTIVSAILFVLIHKRRNNLSKAVFEVYAVAGSLLALTALAYYCKDVGFGPKYSGFLLAAALLFFALSKWLGSGALWLGGILGLMGWYGTFTAWQSVNELFWGMNYPVRFSLFGALVLLFSFVQPKIKLASTQRLTYIAGLILLLTGLWGVSIFGNYNSFEEWAQVRQMQVIIFAVLFAVVGALLFYVGIKYKDDTTRDIAIVALLINLYSRYFEFFWDTTNKGLFFLLLAISFWFIGRRIEKYKKRTVESFQ